MDRRDFLKHGALLGLAGAAAGCATTGVGAAAAGPPVDIHAYVAQLDASLGRIAHADFVRDVALAAHPDGGIDDARLREHEPMIRTALRALTVTGAFADLDASQREHPAIQSRVWGALDELDQAVTGMSSLLASTPAHVRDAVQARLSGDPHVLRNLTEALGSKAADAGLTAKRRRHFTRLMGQIGFRLRQEGATPAIDEYVAAVTKARRDHGARGAQTVAATGTTNELGPVTIEASPAPPRPIVAPSTTHERSPNGIMTVGGVILGLSILGGIGGVAMVALAASSGFLVGFGLFNVTMGALGLIAGIIIVIVGAVASASAPRPQLQPQ